VNLHRQTTYLRDIWESRDTFATVLLASLVKQEGVEALNWEPETVRLCIARMIKQEPNDVNMDKLFALAAALTTNMFYTSVETFHATANALSGSGADFDQFDPVEPEEIAWAVMEVLSNDPPNQTDEDIGARFSLDVRGYIGAILGYNGISRPPRILTGIADYPKIPATPNPEFNSDPDAAQMLMVKNQSDVKALNQDVITRARELRSQLNQFKENLPAA